MTTATFRSSIIGLGIIVAAGGATGIVGSFFGHPTLVDRLQSLIGGAVALMCGVALIRAMVFRRGPEWLLDLLDQLDDL